MKTLSFRQLSQSPMLRFAGVGVISTIIDIGLLKLLTVLGIRVYLATGIGFLAGATNGYLLNSHLVFHRQRSYQGYGKYFVIALIGLLLTELIINIIYVRNGWLPLLSAKLVAVVIVYFWNFTMSRLWTFKE